MAGWFREHFIKPLERSPEWPKVRKAFLQTPGNDCCAACGTKGTTAGLQVHHVVPFSVDPTKELVHTNFITLCEKHHILFGHLNFFQSWNPTVREDCRLMREKIINRPLKTDTDVKVGFWQQYIEFQKAQIDVLKKAYDIIKRS